MTQRLLLKRKILLIVILLILMPIIWIYSSREPNYAEIHQLYNKVINPAGSVVSYGFNARSFRRFLRKPSLNLAGSLCYSFFEYTTSPDIIYNVYTDGFNKDNRLSGIYSGRVASWSLEGWFLRYMTDTTNFQQILSERGIHEHIESVQMIEHSLSYLQTLLIGQNRKMCIWVHTENSDYFLEYNYYLQYLINDSPDECFSYDFYDLDGYRAKYGGLWTKLYSLISGNRVNEYNPGAFSSH